MSKNLARTVQERPSESLAIPTEYYGHERPASFATCIGKYFQNSPRKDGLITIAAHGIILVPGKAGTLEEIFKDGVRNYHCAQAVLFSPMVFVEKTNWTRKPLTARLLESLFVRNKRGGDYNDNALVTNDETETTELLLWKAPPAKSQLRRLKSLGMLAWTLQI